MSIELQSALRFVVLGSAPSSPAQGDAYVSSGNGHLYVYDGAGWVDHGASGGGGGLTNGFAVVDFGAGSTDASVTVLGQAGVSTSSRVKAWVAPVSSVAVDNRSEDEHIVEPLRVFVSDIAAGTGFTLRVMCDLGSAVGKFRIGWEY